MSFNSAYTIYFQQTLNYLTHSFVSSMDILSHYEVSEGLKIDAIIQMLLGSSYFDMASQTGWNPK